MRTFVIAVLLLVIVLLVIVVAMLRRQRDAALVAAGEDRSGRAVIVVDVRNAHELAARRTQLARALSFVAPGMTRSLVHREVIRQLEEEFTQEGVDAHISVRRWPDRPAAPDVASSEMSPVADGNEDASADQPGPI